MCVHLFTGQFLKNNTRVGTGKITALRETNAQLLVGSSGTLKTMERILNTRIVAEPARALCLGVRDPESK